MYALSKFIKISANSDPQSRLLIFTAALLLELQLYVFSPLIVFFGNAEELALSPYTLIKICLSFFAIGYITMLLIWYLLPAKYNRIYIPLISAVALLASIQSNVFVAYYGVLDGGTINFYPLHLRGVFEAIIWLTVITLVIIYYDNLKTFLIKITLAIILFQIVYFSWQIANTNIQPANNPTPIENNSDSKQFFNPNFYKMSSDNNIIHILLDAFQSNIFKEIITENPEYQTNLQGFTFFENNIGIYPTTVMSIPAMMAGKIYENDVPRKEFIASIADDNLQQRLSTAGYIVDIKTIASSCFEQYANCYSAKEPKIPIHYYQFIDYGLFRSSPHFIKRLIYNKQNWLISRLFTNSEQAQFASARTAAYYKDFIDNTYSSVTSPTYKFFHADLPHYPITLEQSCQFIGNKKPNRENYKQQAHCSLNLTLRFLEKLKAMGIYDNSMIIISSDHGITLPLGNAKNTLEKNVIPSSLALLLVKPFNTQDDFNISTKLTSLLDIPNTILSSIQLEPLPQGDPIFSSSPLAEKNIDHQYYYYTWRHRAWEREFLPPVTKYRVRGTPLETSSWHELA